MKNWIKGIVFTVIAVGIFAGVNILVQPIWTEWNHYNTTYGFYEEPENTIETVFLGSSQCIRGFAPPRIV